MNQTEPQTVSDLFANPFDRLDKSDSFANLASLFDIDTGEHTGAASVPCSGTRAITGVRGGFLVWGELELSHRNEWALMQIHG